MQHVQSKGVAIVIDDGAMWEEGGRKIKAKFIKHVWRKEGSGAP